MGNKALILLKRMYELAVMVRRLILAVLEKPFTKKLYVFGGSIYLEKKIHFLQYIGKPLSGKLYVFGELIMCKKDTLFALLYENLSTKKYIFLADR